MISRETIRVTAAMVAAACFLFNLLTIIIR